MDWKVGEIFEYSGEWYQCVEGRCRDCYFSEKRYLCKQFITKNFCTSGIILKKLEKVGEPTIIRGKPHQKFNNFVFRDSRICQYCAFHHKLCDVKCEPYEFYLEIKQNKEDMEEKEWKTETIEPYTRGKRPTLNKQSELKLKSFNLEEAKAGKPVCTRDGRKARIICFDRKGNQPIIALIINEERGIESIGRYFENGHLLFEKAENKGDLMMLPEKKEGWAVIFKDDLLKTEQDAKDLAENSISEVVKIEKIEYEE